MLRYLQGWIGVVGLMAIGNTIGCFRDYSFLSQRLYTGAANVGSEVNPLMARLFGMWTLLAAVIRLCCAFDIYNKTLYHVTFCSFVIVLFHYVSENLIYKTAPITIGFITPVVISVFSIMAMIAGYVYLHYEQSKTTQQEIRKPSRIQSRKTH